MGVNSGGLLLLKEKHVYVCEKKKPHISLKKLLSVWCT